MGPGCGFLANCWMWDRERNAGRPRTVPSAASPEGTALPGQASGLSLLSDSPSVSEQRPRRLFQAATPQVLGSSRGDFHAPAAG